jgi:hypothetical protein
LCCKAARISSASSLCPGVVLEEIFKKKKRAEGPVAAVPEKWAQAVVRKLETQAYRPKPLPEQAPAMHFVVEKGLEKNSKFVIFPLPENLNDEEVAVQFQTGDLVTMAKPSSESDWEGCPGTRLQYSSYSSFTIASIEDGFFTTQSYTTLWAPLSAVEGFSLTAGKVWSFFFDDDTKAAIPSVPTDVHIEALPVGAEDNKVVGEGYSPLRGPFEVSGRLKDGLLMLKFRISTCTSKSNDEHVPFSSLVFQTETSGDDTVLVQHQNKSGLESAVRCRRVKDLRQVAAFQKTELTWKSFELAFVDPATVSSFAQTEVEGAKSNDSGAILAPCEVATLLVPCFNNGEGLLRLPQMLVPDSAPHHQLGFSLTSLQVEAEVALNVLLQICLRLDSGSSQFLVPLTSVALFTKSMFPSLNGCVSDLEEPLSTSDSVVEPSGGDASSQAAWSSFRGLFQDEQQSSHLSKPKGPKKKSHGALKPLDVADGFDFSTFVREAFVVGTVCASDRWLGPNSQLFAVAIPPSPLQAEEGNDRDEDITVSEHGFTSAATSTLWETPRALSARCWDQDPVKSSTGTNLLGWSFVLLLENDAKEAWVKAVDWLYALLAPLMRRQEKLVAARFSASRQQQKEGKQGGSVAASNSSSPETDENLVRYVCTSQNGVGHRKTTNYDDRLESPKGPCFRGTVTGTEVVEDGRTWLKLASLSGDPGTQLFLPIRSKDGKTPLFRRCCSCPKAHALSGFATPVGGFSCEGCKAKKHPKGTYMYGCRTCDFDLCTECFESERSAPLSFLCVRLGATATFKKPSFTQTATTLSAMNPSASAASTNGDDDAAVTAVLRGDVVEGRLVEGGGWVELLCPPSPNTGNLAHFDPWNSLPPVPPKPLLPRFLPLRDLGAGHDDGAEVLRPFVGDAAVPSPLSSSPAALASPTTNKLGGGGRIMMGSTVRVRGLSVAHAKRLFTAYGLTFDSQTMGELLGKGTATVVNSALPPQSSSKKNVVADPRSLTVELEHFVTSDDENGSSSGGGGGESNDSTTVSKSKKKKKRLLLWWPAPMVCVIDSTEASKGQQDMHDLSMRFAVLNGRQGWSKTRQRQRSQEVKGWGFEDQGLRMAVAVKVPLAIEAASVRVIQRLLASTTSSAVAVASGTCNGIAAEEDKVAAETGGTAAEMTGTAAETATAGAAEDNGSKEDCDIGAAEAEAFSLATVPPVRISLFPLRTTTTATASSPATTPLSAHTASVACPVASLVKAVVPQGCNVSASVQQQQQQQQQQQPQSSAGTFVGTHALACVPEDLARACAEVLPLKNSPLRLVPPSSSSSSSMAGSGGDGGDGGNRRGWSSEGDTGIVLSVFHASPKALRSAVAASVISKNPDVALGCLASSSSTTTMSTNNNNATTTSIQALLNNENEDESDEEDDDDDDDEPHFGPHTPASSLSSPLPLKSTAVVTLGRVLSTIQGGGGGAAQFVLSQHSQQQQLTQQQLTQQQQGSDTKVSTVMTSLQHSSTFGNQATKKKRSKGHNPRNGSNGGNGNGSGGCSDSGGGGGDGEEDEEEVVVRSSAAGVGRRQIIELEPFTFHHGAIASSVPATAVVAACVSALGGGGSGGENSGGVNNSNTQQFGGGGGGVGGADLKWVPSAQALFTPVTARFSECLVCAEVKENLDSFTEFW